MITRLSYSITRNQIHSDFIYCGIHRACSYNKAIHKVCLLIHGDSGLDFSTAVLPNKWIRFTNSAGVEIIALI